MNYCDKLIPWSLKILANFITFLNKIMRAGNNVLSWGRRKTGPKLTNSGLALHWLSVSAFSRFQLKKEEFRKPYLMIVLLCKYDRTDWLLFKNFKSYKKKKKHRFITFSSRRISNLLSSVFFLLWKKGIKIILMS